MTELTPRDSILQQYDARNDRVSVYLMGPNRRHWDLDSCFLTAFPATLPLAEKHARIFRSLAQVLRHREP